MSKSRMMTWRFVDKLLKDYDNLKDRGLPYRYELTKLVYQRDRETRNMACSDLISAAEDLIVAPAAAESTETNDQDFM